jgi:hypothetical protein
VRFNIPVPIVPDQLPDDLQALKRIIAAWRRTRWLRRRKLPG